jgi:hypothetical protein
LDDVQFLYCTGLYCAFSYRIVLLVLYCTELLQCGADVFVAPATQLDRSTGKLTKVVVTLHLMLYCIVLYCTSLCCTVLHCDVLYCTAPFQIEVK